MPSPVNPAQAASLYANNAGIGKTAGAGEEGGVSFSKFLEDTAREQINTMKAGETMAAKGVTGEADLTDVVMAVNSAELTLQTVVSIRDRLVQAFQEIMRMPM